MNISIKKRIYIGFSWLIFLFILNSIITVVTLYNNRKLSEHISQVVDPSLQALNDFRKLTVDSKMYSTNWVFLRYNEEDKTALLRLHNKEYKQLKARLNIYALKWNDKSWADSLQKVYGRFNALLQVEKQIMNSLVLFEDYDNPVVKLEAERLVEDEIIPRTANVMYSLEKIIDHEQRMRMAESKTLEQSSASLKNFIAFLAATFIGIGIFLCTYFARVIIKPLERIKHIVNNLGKGITNIIQHNTNKDEIGEMVLSVNNLSTNLQRTASFAREVGNRNFDVWFEPLSEEDTLGKALVAMRDNLKQSDAQLYEAQHIAHLGSWERDLATNKISWSEEMFRIFDVDPATFQLHQQSFLNAVHPEDAERVKALSRRNLNDHQPIAYECRIITPKNVVKTIYIEDKVFLNEQGEIVRTSGIAQDITERKKATLALEAAHAELKTLLESIDQAFFSVDMAKRKVLQMSAASKKIFGYTSEEFFADYKLWWSLIYPDDFEIVNSGYSTLLSGNNMHIEYRIVHKDQSVRWIEVRAVPTLSALGKTVRIDGVIHDISTRKAAELERDRITSDLIVRNKDLEQFTYIVSHNLRAPVTNVMALSNLLKLTNTDTSKENLELLDGLTASINTLDGVILDLNQILAVRTPGYEKKEMVSFSSIITNIKASIQHIIDKESVVIDCDFSEVEMVFSLRSYVYSIFYNLILNSIKYKQPHTSPHINIKSSIKENKTLIIFTDNGKGIDLQKNGKDVFMLYKRFDFSVEGKGIGLYMIKTAIQTLGGNISVQSEVNKGSTFTVELPNKPEELKTPKEVYKQKSSTAVMSY